MKINELRVFHWNVVFSFEFLRQVRININDPSVHCSIDSIYWITWPFVEFVTLFWLRLKESLKRIYIVSNKAFDNSTLILKYQQIKIGFYKVNINKPRTRIKMIRKIRVQKIYWSVKLSELRNTRKLPVARVWCENEGLQSVELLMRFLQRRSHLPKEPACCWKSTNQLALMSNTGCQTHVNGAIRHMEG